MTVAGVTSKPISEYRPAVMTRSWRSAIIAASAIFHSKYSDRKMTTPRRKNTSARRALLEMSFPQLGPMNCVLTSSRATSNSLASAVWTSSSSALVNVSV